MALSFALRNTGRPPGPLPSLRQVQNHAWTEPERAFAADYLAPQLIGGPATVKAKLEALLAETSADEVMAIASVPDAAARARSFTLLAELAQLPV
jgi:alkanesulfonate monooxygenase SsuD/methylene tetrahydromethanopterin reductase-like flavin-dependent oxidoreductase (luciferase family)